LLKVKVVNISSHSVQVRGQEHHPVHLSLIGVLLF